MRANQSSLRISPPTGANSEKKCQETRRQCLEECLWSALVRPDQAKVWLSSDKATTSDVHILSELFRRHALDSRSCNMGTRTSGSVKASENQPQLHSPHSHDAQTPTERWEMGGHSTTFHQQGTHKQRSLTLENLEGASVPCCETGHARATCPKR